MFVGKVPDPRHAVAKYDLMPCLVEAAAFRLAQDAGSVSVSRVAMVSTAALL